MAFAIAISFRGGRFHATPWGHHVNEGLPEWPPSPWRLLRALLAVWKQNLSDNPLVNDHLPPALTKLASPPVFRLPPASLGHTRHFMPWWKNWQPHAPDKAKTLVFDAFVALPRDAEVVCSWPNVNLSPEEEQAMRLVLSHMNYFGRAESWCTAHLCARSWSDLPGQLCTRIDTETGEVLDGGSAKDMEPVRVLCLNTVSRDPSMRWDGWAYGNKVARPDPVWNLLARTDDMHKERWSDPPGACWVTYLRPVDAFAVEPSGMCVAHKAREPVTAVRFALDGTVLPRITETVYVAELARRYIQGRFGKLNDGLSSPVFSGKARDGQRLDDNHQHAFCLPTDDDRDGRLDHLTVFCQAGVGERELEALDAFRQMYGPGGTRLGLLLLGTGRLQSVPLLTRATKWRSVTPFIGTRHYKRRGKKRDTCPPEGLPEVNLREEIARRGLPVPSSITRLPRYELATGSSLSWLEFRRERVFGNGRHGAHPGMGFQIEFAEPVDGPIALGYACHFGLGLFMPV